MIRILIAATSLAIALGACLPEPRGASKGKLIAVEAQPTEAPAAALGAKDLPQGAADAGPRGNPDKGEAHYNKVCKACHQKDGSGMNGMLAADLVKDKTRLAQPDSVLLDRITNGYKGKKLEMPPQGKILSPQEIKDTLAYVRKTFGSK